MKVTRRKERVHTSDQALSDTLRLGDIKEVLGGLLRRHRSGHPPEGGGRKGTDAVTEHRGSFVYAGTLGDGCSCTN